MIAGQQPTGGTFTMRWRHGVSDPLPYNAEATMMTLAEYEVARRDAAIQQEHDRNPDLAMSCRVCNPPPREVHLRRHQVWKQRIRRVLWGVPR